MGRWGQICGLLSHGSNVGPIMVNVRERLGWEAGGPGSLPSLRGSPEDTRRALQQAEPVGKGLLEEWSFVINFVDSERIPKFVDKEESNRILPVALK